MSRDKLEILAKKLKTEYYKIGQKIIKQHTAGTKFYIISEGQCAVLKEETDSFGNLKEKLLVTLKKGKCFGEVALLSNAPRMASVVADASIVAVLSLSKSDFECFGLEMQTSYLKHHHKHLVRESILDNTSFVQNPFRR